MLTLRLTEREATLVENALRERFELLMAEGLSDEGTEVAAIPDKLDLGRSSA